MTSAKTFRFSKEMLDILEELSKECNPNKTELLEKCVAFVYGLWKANKIGIAPVLQASRPYFVGKKTLTDSPSIGEHTQQGQNR